ncbi:MAG: hypothetical protein NVSMB31_01430 [Vulcanimicrobiaceae bacterium]
MMEFDESMLMDYECARNGHIMQYPSMPMRCPYSGCGGTSFMPVDAKRAKKYRDAMKRGAKHEAPDKYAR